MPEQAEKPTSSQEMHVQFSLVLVCEANIDASNVAYQLLELCNNRVMF